MEGLNPNEAAAALHASAPHLAAISIAARDFFRAAVRLMEIDERMRIADVHDLLPEGERAASHVVAAAHALNDHFHAAVEAMTAALTPRSAIRFDRQVRRHVYIPHFQNEPDIGSEIYQAIEQSGPNDPRIDAITDLLLSWRETDEQLIAEMIDIINRTTDAAEEVNHIHHELELRKFLRAEHAARTLLRLDAIDGAPRQ